MWKVRTALFSRGLLRLGPAKNIPSPHSHREALITYRVISIYFGFTHLSLDEKSRISIRKPCPNGFYILPAPDAYMASQTMLLTPGRPIPVKPRRLPGYEHLGQFGAEHRACTVCRWRVCRAAVAILGRTDHWRGCCRVAEPLDVRHAGPRPDGCRREAEVNDLTPMRADGSGSR